MVLRIFLIVLLFCVIGAVIALTVQALVEWAIPKIKQRINKHFIKISINNLSIFIQSVVGWMISVSHKFVRQCDFRDFSNNVIAKKIQNVLNCGMNLIKNMSSLYGITVLKLVGAFIVAPFVLGCLSCFVCDITSSHTHTLTNYLVTPILGWASIIFYGYLTALFIAPVIMLFPAILTVLRSPLFITFFVFLSVSGITGWILCELRVNNAGWWGGSAPQIDWNGFGNVITSISGLIFFGASYVITGIGVILLVAIFLVGMIGGSNSSGGGDYSHFYPSDNYDYSNDDDDFDATESESNHNVRRCCFDDTSVEIDNEDYDVVSERGWFTDMRVRDRQGKEKLVNSRGEVRDLGWFD